MLNFYTAEDNLCEFSPISLTSLHQHGVFCSQLCSAGKLALALFMLQSAEIQFQEGCRHLYLPEPSARKCYRHGWSQWAQAGGIT